MDPKKMNKFSTIKDIWSFNRPLSEIYQSKNNAFDILRFIMASLVIVFHSYALTASGKTDFFAIFVKGQSNLGEFAVGSFFVISGFLITQSLINSKNVIEYFGKRTLRLFPALFMSLFLTSFILGPAISSQGASAYYLGQNGPSPLRFFFVNLSLNIFGWEYFIRDIFSHNPYPYAVNGSLWTLKHEFASYLFLAGLGGLGFLKNPKRLILLEFFIGAAYLANYLGGVHLLKGITNWWIFNETEYPYFLKLFWLFLFGSILHIYKEKIYISTKLFVLCLGIMLASIYLGLFYYAWYLFAPYLLISTAISIRMSWFSKFGDFSYGIYVYAFPVQQFIVLMLYPHLSAVQLMGYSFTATLLIAILSWHLVEKPMLGLKSKLAFLRHT